MTLCDKPLPGEKQHAHLVTPDRDPITDQSTDTTKGQLGEPMNSLGFVYRNMGERLLTGAEMTQRQLHHQCPS